MQKKDTSAAKAAALQLARQHAGTTKAFHPSHTSTLCSRARAQAAHEVWKTYSHAKADAALKASKVSSVHVAPVQDAPRKAVAGMSQLPKTPWVQRLESLDTETRIKVMREQIRTEAAHVGASTDFADKEEWGRAGLDSLSMVEMRMGLQRELGEALRLSSTMLLDYPTPEALAQHIDAELFPKVQAAPKVLAVGVSKFPKTPWVQRLESLDTETGIKVIREQIRTEAAHVGASTDFADEEEWGRAGLDSLSMVEMRMALQRELGEALRLSSTMLFDYPTPEALAQHIEAELFPKVPVAGLEFRGSSSQESGHPFVGRCEREGEALMWTCKWGESIVEYLRDFRVRDVPVVPGSCYLEMVGPAVEEVYGNVAYELRNVRFEGVLPLEEGRAPTMRLVFGVGGAGEGEGGREVSIESCNEDRDGWKVHARMRLVVLGGWLEPMSVEDIKGRCGEAVECEDFYTTLRNAFRGDFSSLARVWEGEGELLGQIEMGNGVGGDHGGAPAFLRTCAWVEVATHMPLFGMDLGERMVGMFATGLDACRVWGTSRLAHDRVWSLVQGQAVDGAGTLLVTVCDDEGKVLVQIRGLGIGTPQVGNVNEPCSVWVDEWEKAEVTTTRGTHLGTGKGMTRLDGAVLRPQSVAAMHAAVVTRMEAQPELRVEVSDEEVAAYLRCLRKEFPSWRVMWVRNDDGDGDMPDNGTEHEWRYRDRLWCVRRLHEVHVLPQLRYAKHTGKVVIERPLLMSQDGCYVISGGLGYLGRLVAEALIGHGAQRLVLLDNIGSELPPDWELEVRPVVERCDVGELAEVERVIGRHSNIKGIVHAAAAARTPTAIGELREEDFWSVYRPKVEGARHLHSCSAGLALDFFVLFSSIASGLGLEKLAHDGAANGCLDALAEERASAGLPVLSVRWGAWAGDELASDANLGQLGREGLLPVLPSQGIKTLMQLLRQPPGPVVMVCPMDPRRLPDTPYVNRVRARVAKGMQQKLGDPGEGWWGWRGAGRWRGRDR